MTQAQTLQSSIASGIIYIHGFNSSPKSSKAQLFSDYCARNYPQLTLHVPALSYDPSLAIAELEELICKNKENKTEVKLLVGSSLGGYYATYLAEKFNIKAALINPVVFPCRHMGADLLGAQVNNYNGEEYELTMEHVGYFRSLEIDVLQYPQNFLLLAQTGDKVLDYKHAVDYYRESMQIVQEGGDHGFENFTEILPDIFKFSELSQKP